MIWNLLTNSVKFTPSGGRIDVKVEQSGDTLQIIVSDTGQGIDPNFVPFVFDRFRQQDSSITRRAGGLGIGLAIVRHLAELHGGSVSVTSEGDGKGASFTITLPLTIASTEVLEEIPLPKTNGNNSKSDAIVSLKNVRVLVVDDDKDTLEMMTYILNHWGRLSQ
jgi:signal transduction histidine kinase